MSLHALQEGERVAKESIVHLIILGISKILVGYFTGLTVIIADGISTFADTLGVFASYIGLRLSRRSADKNFEYGYYKVETFMAFIISLGIVYLAYEIFQKGLKSFNSSPEGHFLSLGVLVTVGAIYHAWKMSKKLGAVGKKVNSLALLASARDKKMDVFAGIAILGSIFANQQQIPYIEGIITMVISLIILKEGLITLKESLFFLLDYWNDPNLVRKIRRVINHEKDLIPHIKKLRLRRAGTFIFGEAFVEINPFAGIQDLREELDLLQVRIKDLNPYIKDFSIYTHITKSQKVKVAVPVKIGQSMSAKIASDLKETKGYIFVTIKNNRIKDHYYKALKFKRKNLVEFANFLKDEKVNILIDNKLNSLVYYNLRRTHHILIYPNFSDINTVGDTIKLLLIDS